MITKSKTAFVSVALLCGLGFSVTACPASLDDRCADSACISTTTGGEGGIDVLVDGGSDAPVDPCVETPSDPKCLTEATAIFVSTKAPVAGADGSRAHPFKTITAALAAVNSERKRLYVCEGDYLENVSVRTPSVSILGGLTCDFMGKGANPRIAPPKGVALSIVKSNGVAVTDVNVEGSADSQVDGDSAIGVFVSESQGVLLRRVNVKAGPGTKGVQGADGSTSPNYPTPIAIKGTDTASSAAAPAPACGTCVDGTLSSGGAGAAAAAFPSAGSAVPPVGTDNTGGTVGGACVDGKPGAAGVAGGAAAASQVPGSVNASGWTALTTAKKGTNGNPGQGGGGAGSTAALGGGAGGCGGCGGTGGSPGGNGGSSLALLTFDADVTLEDSGLIAGAGGIGGIGGHGQDGQVRGPAGGGVCSGGVGGHGAGGGGGGGGAGGHSAAIAHSGKPPSQKNCTAKRSLGGEPGSGGAGGMSTGNGGATGNNGAKGLDADVLPL